MKYRLLKWVLPLAGLAILAGCGGGIGTSGNANNPLDGDAASVRISMQAQEGVPSLGTSQIKANELGTSDSVGTPVTLTDAWVNVERFKVEIPGSCDSIDFQLPANARCETESESEDEDDGSTEENEAELEVEGPYQVDLINGTLFPELPPFQIPSGTVKEVKVKVGPLHEEVPLPAGVPTELSGYTLFAQGSALVNGVDTPFTLQLKFDAELEFRNLDGIPISEAVDVNKIILSLDVNQWFQGLDLEKCVDDGEIQVEEGTIIISADSGSGDCSDIEDVIKDNIEQSGSLEHEDVDDSHDDDHGSDDSSDDSSGDDS